MKNLYTITVASEKGGVGKTTLATNLAIYLKAHREDLPVTILSFDNHFTVDKMFGFQGRRGTKNSTLDVLEGRVGVDESLLFGEYGVKYIPSSSDSPHFLNTHVSHRNLFQALQNATLSGVLIIDTRPDMGISTQAALYVSDRILIPVKDQASLENAKHIYSLADNYQITKNKLLIIPSLIDSRIRFDGVFETSLDLIRAYSAHKGYMCYEDFISKSPKVEKLNTNPDGRIYPVLTHGRQTEVHLQLKALSKKVLLEAEENDSRRLGQIKRIEKENSILLETEAAITKSSHDTACPICSQPKPNNEYIIESGDLQFYAHFACVHNKLISPILNPKEEPGSFNPELFKALLDMGTIYLSLSREPTIELKREGSERLQVGKLNKLLENTANEHMIRFASIGKELVIRTAKKQEVAESIPLTNKKGAAS